MVKLNIIKRWKYLIDNLSPLNRPVEVGCSFWVGVCLGFEGRGLDWIGIER